MFSTVTTYLGSSLSSFHEHIKTIPVAGKVYTAFNENIGQPGYNLGCRVINAATPYFRSGVDPVISHICRNPIKYSLIGGCLLFALVRALTRAEPPAPPKPGDEVPPAPPANPPAQ